jgi:probable F420-dependent oxidoreductase
MQVETGLMGFQGAPLTFEEIAAASRKVEDLGFNGLNSGEAGGHDALVPLFIAAANTKRITLGTGVIIAFPRTPMALAQEAWDLQRLSGCRFKLGLGTQVKAHNERRFSAPWTAGAGPRMREYILCLQAIFKTFQDGPQAPPTYYKGQHYQFTLMTPFFNPGPLERPVPIHVGGINQYLVRLAGEICDGLCYHPFCTPKYMKEMVLPTIEAGARKAGRDPAKVSVWGSPMVAAGRNKAELEAAKANVRMNIAFYGSTRTYWPVLDIHGLHDLGVRLYQRSIEGKWQEMMDLISDEMMDEFAIVGTYDRVVPKLKERWSGILDSITVRLPWDTPADEKFTREAIQALRS